MGTLGKTQVYMDEEFSDLEPFGVYTGDDSSPREEIFESPSTSPVEQHQSHRNIIKYVDETEFNSLPLKIQLKVLDEIAKLERTPRMKIPSSFHFEDPDTRTSYSIQTKNEEELLSEESPEKTRHSPEISPITPKPKKKRLSGIPKPIPKSPKLTRGYIKKHPNLAHGQTQLNFPVRKKNLNFNNLPWTPLL
ncbi:hypothetical protein DMENIID0001_114950 [Sergentomyia squamirostris]